MVPSFGTVETFTEPGIVGTQLSGGSSWYSNIGYVLIGAVCLIWLVVTVVNVGFAEPQDLVEWRDKASEEKKGREWREDD